jgi:hypothetical protein
VRSLAAAVVITLGACAADAPPFTYELYVHRLGAPPVAIDGDATFEHQSWEFGSYAEARDAFGLDVTYGEPPQHGELRPVGCELEGQGQPPRDLDRLVSQRVTVGATPTDIISMWCTSDSGDAWGLVR